jgi:uncharacterized protein
MSEAVTQQAPLSPTLTQNPPAFFQLDPRITKLWRFSDALGYGIAWFIVLVLLLVLSWVRTSWAIPVLFGWSAIVLLTVAWIVWYPARAYRAWSWRIDDKVLETRSGIWFKHQRLLPLSRLQHIDLESGPLARRFGLASLVLHTAGTQNASLTIPGLDAAYAEQLRNWLVELGANDAA